MAQEIYNEGRVVGLSAWEIFYKEAISNGVPPSKVPNEPEWLASMIGSGASMILRIDVGMSGVQDFELPVNSSLSAAGVIVASPFMGTCAWDDSSPWATKVTSYSSLIQNTTTDNPPVVGKNTVPYDDNYTDSEFIDCVTEFTRLTDGIVFTKNADWLDNAPGTSPAKDIDPNFNNSSTVVRLYLNSVVTKEIRVLLTGFTNKTILQGLSGHAIDNQGVSQGGSTDTLNNNWPNGGMLGPEIIPWASKIIFAVPSAAYSLDKSMTRTIPSDATYTAEKIANAYTFKNVSGTIKANPLFDFNSIVLTDYYDANTFSTSPIINESVSAVSLGGGESCNVGVAWYPGMTATKINETKALSTDAEKKARFFPPALYVAQVTSNGTQRLVPMDTAAPGTVKGFEDPDKAYIYRQLLPNNYALYHNTTTNTYSFVTSTNDPNVWSGTAKLEYISGSYPMAKLTVGSQETKIVTLSHPDGQGGFIDYGLNGQGGTTPVGPANNLTWADLLTSLNSNNAVDVLGTKLHDVGNELTSDNTIGVTHNVTKVGATTLRLNGANAVEMTADVSGGTNVAKLGNGTSIKVGTNFIEFGNGKRLYISNTDPGTANVPDGSIGIGW